MCEAGQWELYDGTLLEAHAYLSQVTDYSGGWVGENQTGEYLHDWDTLDIDPVVMGQVMSYNDTDWSVFWSCDSTTYRTDPPSQTSIYTGKHVGKDTDYDRADEIVGWLAIEPATGTIDSIDYDVYLGSDNVTGIQAASPYAYSLNFTASVCVATLEAMDGYDGGWAVLYGGTPLANGEVDLVIDEDLFETPPERWHTDTQVAVFAFSSAGSFLLYTP